MVGSIDTSEFIVALGGSAGFLLALGAGGVNVAFAGALLVGGVIAAPFAAWLVRILAPRVLGVAAGGLIILTNLKTILEAAGVSGQGVATVAAVVAVTWVAAITWAVRQERATRTEVQKDEVLYA